jgi:CRISPR-associated protein (TIGR03986 family)
MKKAKLVKHGKGWRLEGEKVLFVPGGFGLTDDMDGQEVEFDNTGGPVKRIRFDGKDYTRQQKQGDMGNNRDNKIGRGGGRQGGGQQQRYQGKRAGGQGQPRDPARAPYNFVPLNENVVPAINNVGFDEFTEGRLSGYLDLDIEALTDIFVRGELEKFFSINGNFAIPGSSLRGLIRSLVEIVSYSRMEFVEKKKKLFFRNISDQHYKDIFLEVNKGDVRQKSKAGWLSKSGSKFFLQEAPVYYKLSRNKLRDIGLDKQNEVYKTYPIFFDPKSVKEIHQKIIKTKRGEKRFNLYYNKISSISRGPRQGLTEATLMITGLFGSKKHFQWIIPPPKHNVYKHDVTAIMAEYQLDENRDEKADLIRALHRAKGDAIPCFFIPDFDGKPVAIGHTGIFRYPYKYNIGHAIKQNNGTDSDFAKSIFGFVDSRGSKNVVQAGKVFFEDAFATKVKGTEFGALRILSSPKPTSFQLYLEQPNDGEHHWGTDGHKIRGNKLYWHSSQSWKNEEVLVTSKNKLELIRKALVDKNTQYTVGEVLKAGTEFVGRIRFENLTEEELGALLFALDLPDGCAHKLGMGKSLGMGSVRIKSALKIIDRHRRYQVFFEKDSSWSEGVADQLAISLLKAKFAAYMGEKTNQQKIKNENDYWSIDDRMKELKNMVTFLPNVTGVSWENRTRYMLIEHPNYHPKNEYMDKNGRHVLPKPSKVVQTDTYQKD